MMHSKNEWKDVLEDHPIFSLPSNNAITQDQHHPLELSTTSLSRFARLDDEDTDLPSFGRRQLMIIRDGDLIVASGSEIRMASLSESKLRRHPKEYKVLQTSNVDFEILQITLNPNGKLLAVSGKFKVVIIVLPRVGYSRVVNAKLDCKSLQVGQYHHASSTSPPVAQIEWHPWGEAGSTIMVMTTDGKLREYDIAVDPEEPQQVVSFVPDRKGGRYLAEDASERQVASFTLGKGSGDWGPLTVYVVMRSGDIYAVCPYLPTNASIPSSYVHSLECFVAAKQEFLDNAGVGATSTSESRRMAAMYDHQAKYLSALLRQLPAGTASPALSKPVLVHPPTVIKAPPVRQGPFLLQPSPRTLEGSEGGEATDIAYVTLGDEYDAQRTDDSKADQPGVILVAFQDGKVDVCLDVNKVEAKWETKQRPEQDLPMLAVYETIDLGTVDLLSTTQPPLLELIQGNYPIFRLDPMHEDIVYVYHAFGVHAFDFGPVFRSLGELVREDRDEIASAVPTSKGCTVLPIITTFSVENRSSNPVVAVVVPNDVYLTYAIFILTSMMRILSFPLTLRADLPEESLQPIPSEPSTQLSVDLLPSSDDPPAYVSLLGQDPFVPPPILSRSGLGLPNNPRLALAAPAVAKQELRLTPDTLRFLGKTVERFTGQIREVQLAHRDVEVRALLQQQELQRQQQTCGRMLQLIDRLKHDRQRATQTKLEKCQESHKALLVRLDHVLQQLMQKASPELSEHETKWFRELSRMKEEVKGAGRYDQDSLNARTKSLEKEMARILPDMKDLHSKEAERRKQNNQALGASQAFEFGERSTVERSRIREIEDDVQYLATKLDVTLSKPPSSS